jgi:hypothetical protein
MTGVRLAVAAAACVLLVLAGLPTTRDDGRTGAPRAAQKVAFQPTRVAPELRRERRRAARRLGRGARIATERGTGGVRFAGKLDGFLTGPHGGDAADIALDYVRRRPGIFGLDRRELAQLKLADVRNSHGLILLRWT